MKTTLYKQNKGGSTQEWTIEYPVFNNGSWYYHVTYGQKDGAMQTQITEVFGKNIGKSNETTPEEQCTLEAESKIRKQQDKGYDSSIIGNKMSIVYKPMLAKEYSDAKHKITFPCYIQPKSDGVRCISYFNGSEWVLQSRQNKIFTLPHISNKLLSQFSQYKNHVLDGELYIHNTPLQRIISLLKKNQVGSTDIEYHIYDTVSKFKFEDRFNIIQNIGNISDNIKLVKTIKIQNDNELDTYHQIFIQQGYEGSIIRSGDLGYEEGYRSYSLIKRKEEITEEFEIVDFKPNQKLQGTCVLVLKTKDGELFDCMPEGTMEYRQQLFMDAQSLIGEMATVKFYDRTERNVPKFATIITIRDYE